MTRGPLRPPGGPPAPPDGALDRFSAWLTALGDALEAADAEAMRPLFTVEAIFAPDPFVGSERGRRAVVERLVGEVAGSTSLRFEARVLGAGATYGVAHVRLASLERTVDGVLLVAMDARGRCTALRRWSHASATGASSPDARGRA